jgi:hypothetical protein
MGLRAELEQKFENDEELARTRGELEQLKMAQTSLA